MATGQLRGGDWACRALTAPHLRNRGLVVPGLQTGSSVSTSRNRRIDVSIPLPDALLRGPSVVVVGRVNAPVMRP